MDRPLTRRHAILAVLALPAGCAIQPLAPLPTQPLAAPAQAAALRPPATGQRWFYRQLNAFNSAVVAVSIMAVQVLTSSLAAYAFVMFDFRGKGFLFGAVLATMMIPGEAILISNYLTVASARLLDSYWGLFLPYGASAMGVFLMRQQFLTVPKEFREAATMDGCTDWRFFWRILMPVSVPAISALAVY